MKSLLALPICRRTRRLRAYPLSQIHSVFLRSPANQTVSTGMVSTLFKKELFELKNLKSFNQDKKVFPIQILIYFQFGTFVKAASIERRLEERRLRDYRERETTEKRLLLERLNLEAAHQQLSISRFRAFSARSILDRIWIKAS